MTENKTNEQKKKIMQSTCATTIFVFHYLFIYIVTHARNSDLVVVGAVVVITKMVFSSRYDVLTAFHENYVRF